MNNKKLHLVKQIFKVKSSNLKAKNLEVNFLSKHLQALSQINNQRFDSLNLINDMQNRLNESIKSMLEPLSQLSFKLPVFEFKSTFLEIIREEYTGEKLNEKVVSARKWGEFGWVLYSEMSIPEILNPPDSQISADLIVLNVFDEQLMKSNLLKIKDNIFIRKDYIDDIIFLYENNRYNTCVMVLLNSLERIILSHMKLDVNEFGLNYNINSKSKNSSFSKLDDFKDMQITYLNAHNLSILLESTFKSYGKDWNSEPEIIVRDYINHGMSNIVCTRTEAIKLILFLIELSDWSNTVIEMNRKELTNSN